MDMKLELVPMPVTDIDRARSSTSTWSASTKISTSNPPKAYASYSSRPAGSACSIVLSSGLPALAGMAPGSIKGLHLVVSDINHAREQLVSRGVDVGEIDDTAGGGVKYARFSDPDGNTLVLQEMAWRTGDAF